MMKKVMLSVQLQKILLPQATVGKPATGVLLSGPKITSECSILLLGTHLVHRPVP